MHEWREKRDGRFECNIHNRRRTIGPSSAAAISAPSHSPVRTPCGWAHCIYVSDQRSSSFIFELESGYYVDEDPIRSDSQWLLLLLLRRTSGLRGVRHCVACGAH